MLSIIIPTHNRADILKKCLERLLVQRGADFEVIVVDDGSTDHTESAVREFHGVSYIKQDHVQQGVARNRGAEIARGDVIVFIGDDIFAEQGFLKNHYEAHRLHPAENTVVTGYTTWDPALSINDYMRFLESSGWQFGYGFLKPGFVERSDKYKFFYTSNISMKKSFFERARFDETFRGYGWEDVELGYRLARDHGMRLFYEPAARALHHHQTSDADLPGRMQSIGRGARVFEELHPEVHLIPRGWKRLLIQLAINPLGMWAGRLLGKNFVYKLKCWKYFFNRNCFFGTFFVS